jgi:hypothetical protein
MFLPSRSCAVKLDASPHCGIQGSFLGRRIFDPCQRFLLQSAAAFRIVFGWTFFRHALGLARHLVEECFDTSQPFVALDCEM